MEEDGGLLAKSEEEGDAVPKNKRCQSPTRELGSVAEVAGWGGPQKEVSTEIHMLPKAFPWKWTSSARHC